MSELTYKYFDGEKIATRTIIFKDEVDFVIDLTPGWRKQQEIENNEKETN